MSWIIEIDETDSGIFIKRNKKFFTIISPKSHINNKYARELISLLEQLIDMNKEE